MKFPGWCRSWFWMLCVAFAVRIVIAWGVQTQLDQHLHRSFLIPGDADGYWELAGKLLRREDYAIYDPPRYVLRMPGFPLLIAGARWVCQDHFLGVRILLALVGTLACGLVCRLGTLLCSERVGLIAGWLAALSPTLAGFSVLILSETPFAAALLASLIAVARWMPSDEDSEHRLGRWCAASAGFWMGVANQFRPSWLLFAPLSVLVKWFYVLRKLRRAPSRRLMMSQLVQTVLLFGSMGLVFLPWTIRNYQVTGHVIPTTLWMGPSLYDGLNPRATGDSDMTFLEEDGIYQRMSEYDADQYYRRKAWEFLQENPGRSLQLAGAKLARYASPWPNAPQFQNWGLRLMVAGFFLPMLLLAGIGCWNIRRFIRPEYDWSCGLLLTLGPMVYFALIHMVFVGSIRYRLPTEYPFLILTAIGIEVLLARWRQKRSA